VHYRHVRHTLALMCAKNHLLIFSGFLDIWENVEWPRFFGPPCMFQRPFYRQTWVSRSPSVFLFHSLLVPFLSSTNCLCQNVKELKTKHWLQPGKITHCDILIQSLPDCEGRDTAKFRSAGSP